MRSSMAVELSAGDVPVIDTHMAILRLTGGSLSYAGRHNILVLDCSASMTGSLEEVKNHARQFVAELDIYDYVTIAVFSGHHTARVICTRVGCSPEGKQLLDAAIRDEVYIMNTTVFSEPLQVALASLQEVTDASIAHQVILFTDGCAVPTQWGVAEEKARTIMAAKNIFDFGAVVSVIGYGVHYDENFGGVTGIFRHMNDVDDFAEVIRDIRTTFAKVDVGDIKLDLDFGEAQIDAVYRTLPEVVQVSHNGAIRDRGLFEGTITYYIALSGPVTSVSVKGTAGGKRVKYDSPAKIMTPDQRVECIQVVAAQAALDGDASYAIELLRQIGEDGVAETLAEAYTVREYRTYRDRTRRAFRHRQFFGVGLKATGPNHCVLNVLRTLMEDSSVILSLPADGYVRSGLLRQDPRVIHSPLGRTLQVIGYTSHKSRWNFSVITKKDVKVLPVDADGRIIPDGVPVDSVVHRTYNIICDGELVMPRLYASMSRASVEQLQAADVIDPSLSYNPRTSYELNLADMKLVSAAWARPASLRLVDLLVEEAELMAEQKALNARAKALGYTATTGFDEHGVYHEKAAPLTEEPSEYYTAPCVEVQLVKYKALDYTDQAARLDLPQAVTRVKEVRHRLKTVRFLARSIAFACELTEWGSMAWGSPQTTRGGKLEFVGELSQRPIKRLVSTMNVAIG